MEGFFEINLDFLSFLMYLIQQSYCLISNSIFALIRVYSITGALCYFAVVTSSSDFFMFTIHTFRANGNQRIFQDYSLFYLVLFKFTLNLYSLKNNNSLNYLCNIHYYKFNPKEVINLIHFLFYTTKA